MSKDMYIVTDTEALLDELVTDNGKLMEENRQLKLSIERLEKTMDSIRDIGYCIIKEREDLRAKNEELKNALLKAEFHKS